MLGYILFLVFSVLLTFAINGVYGSVTNEFTIWYALLGAVGNTVIIFCLDVVISFIIHKLPPKWFNPNLKIFKVFKKEKRILEKIGVRKWKDLVPDMGCLCDFKKGKVESDDLNYLYKFLEESCYAEAIHIGMILCGFISIIIWPIDEVWNFTFPLAMVNLCLNLPPVLIQRYNRPRLLNLYNFKKRNENK